MEGSDLSGVQFIIHARGILDLFPWCLLAKFPKSDFVCKCKGQGSRVWEVPSNPVFHVLKAASSSS